MGSAFELARDYYERAFRIDSGFASACIDLLRRIGLRR
jgi:hypothetical protein